MSHQHRWAPVLGTGGRYRLRCLEPDCRRLHRLPVSEHEWERPGRDRAHGRPVRCSCCGIEVGPFVRLDCPRHGRGGHSVRVRQRGGLAFGCLACKREEAAAREIDPEVARAASLSYYRTHGAARRRERSS